jgi:excisionase family DNA binding protein
MVTQIAARASRSPAKLLPVPVAAERLGCSEMHIYRLVSTGELRAVDISLKGAGKSKTRIREDDLDAYIEARTRRAAPVSPGTPAALRRYRPLAPSRSPATASPPRAAGAPRRKETRHPVRIRLQPASVIKALVSSVRGFRRDERIDHLESPCPLHTGTVPS